MPEFAGHQRGITEDFWPKVVNSAECSVYSGCKRGGFMLKKEYIRDGKNKIIGSTTSGYTGAFETIIRDEHERVVGTTSERFHTSRDERGGLVSTNSTDLGLLISRKK
jgi:hypothetical protein